MENINNRTLATQQSSVVTTLNKTTPYMLRQDGALLTCGTAHPYIKPMFKDTYTDMYKNVYTHTYWLTWLYDNTNWVDTKEQVIDLLTYIAADDQIETNYSKQALEILINAGFKIDNVLIKELNLNELLDQLNYNLNQEFCRVRTSNFKYQYGGDNGEIYFRISSQNFNWFNLIWKTIVDFANSIKYITIIKDYATFGTSFDYYKYNNIVFNKVPVDEFLVIKGNPILENENTMKTFKNTDILENESVNETIEKHGELNKKLFGKDNKLRPEVKDKILAIVNDFTNGLDEDGIKFDLADIVLVGSNCSYNYTEDSDLDIHLCLKTDNLNCPDNLYPLLYSAYRSLWNKGHDITIYGIPVELFIETELFDETPSDKFIITDQEEQILTEANIVDKLVSNGIYSVLHDKWIKFPDKDIIPEIDQTLVDDIVAKWVDKYETILKYPTIEDIENYIEKLYSIRRQGISEEGEYSVQNLVFKELRNLGYLENLKDLKHTLKDKELSLEQADINTEVDESLLLFLS